MELFTKKLKDEDEVKFSDHTPGMKTDYIYSGDRVCIKQEQNIDSILKSVEQLRYAQEDVLRPRFKSAANGLYAAQIPWLVWKTVCAKYGVKNPRNVPPEIQDKILQELNNGDLQAFRCTNEKIPMSILKTGFYK